MNTGLTQASFEENSTRISNILIASEESFVEINEAFAPKICRRSFLMRTTNRSPAQKQGGRTGEIGRAA